MSVHRAKAVRIYPLGSDNKPCTSLPDDSQSEAGDYNSEEASLKTDNGGAVTTTMGKEFSTWNADMERMAPVAMEMRYVTITARRRDVVYHQEKFAKCCMWFHFIFVV